jgi:hypothetical protein
MRKAILAAFVLALTIAPASAQVSVVIGGPGVTVGINVPVYPRLVRVPGYPVYYAPQTNANYFFYDGMYWIYAQENWYASSWYNGPWQFVSPNAVPVYVLRVPVRYYRRPPGYFRSWSPNAAPRWDEQWGSSWTQSHRGWNSGNHGAMPQAAPLPVYQRQYSGHRYPPPEQQQVLHARSYRYQPKDVVVRQQYQGQQVQTPSAPYAVGNPSRQEQKQGKQMHRQAEQAQKQGAKESRKQSKQHGGPKGGKNEKAK